MTIPYCLEINVTLDKKTNGLATRWFGLAVFFLGVGSDSEPANKNGSNKNNQVFTWPTQRMHQCTRNAPRKPEIYGLTKCLSITIVSF